MNHSTLADNEGNDVHFIVAVMMVERKYILGMAWLSQQISLSKTSTSFLKDNDERNEPVSIVLYLNYCMRLCGNFVEGEFRTQVWDTIQPIITMTFLKPVSDEFVLFIALVRTSPPLVVGPNLAVLNFSLEND
ncbi:hypothetical protein [Huaxiibacter chinensis]